MKLLLQWDKDWEPADSKDWVGLSDPRQLEAVCIQGIVFSEGFIGIEHKADGACVVWNWHGTGSRAQGSVSTFRHLEPDPKLDGDYNTHQTRDAYASPAILPLFGDFSKEPAPAWLHPWAEFPPVPVGVPVRSLTPAATAKSRQRPVSWCEWTEGVPLTRLDRKGFVRVR